jgi:hypothetical protein
VTTWITWVEVPSQQLSGLAAKQCLTLPSGDRGKCKLRQKSPGPRGPTHQGGERILGPQRRANTAAPKWLPTRNGSWGIEQPSPSRTGEGQRVPTKVTDQWSRHLLRRMGGGTRRRVNVIKQGRSRRREGSGHKSRTRRREATRLADGVVVAMMPRDNITREEQRTRGAAACQMKRGPSRHASGPRGKYGRVVKVALRARQTRGAMRGRSRLMGACGPAALKPYWGKPTVRNFRGAWGNGATEDAKRARSWKRRIRPSVLLRAAAPHAYSTNPHARFERGPCVVVRDETPGLMVFGNPARALPLPG